MDQVQYNEQDLFMSLKSISKTNIVVYLKYLSEPLKPNFLVYGLISTIFFHSTGIFYIKQPYHHNFWNNNSL